MSPSFSALDPSAACLISGEGWAVHSRFVQRIRRRYAPWLGLLTEAALTRPTLQQAYQSLRQGGHEVGAALRILRHLVIERLVVMDTQNPQSTPLSIVTAAMTELAEFALDVAILDLPERFTAADVERAMQGHVLAEAAVHGTYSLNPACAA